MPRKKITEYKGKSLLYDFLKLNYKGVKVTPESFVADFKKFSENNFVFKVDQGVKKRFKRGLIGVNIKKKELKKYLEHFVKSGFSSFLLEEYIDHETKEEKYLSIELVRNGYQIIYSPKGGIEIEDNTDSLKKWVVGLDDTKIQNKISETIGVSDFIEDLIRFMDRYFISFLEINPFIVRSGKLYILDLAIEVDSTGEYFADNWSGEDLISENLNDKLSKQELEIEKLKEKSTASFRLNVLNPNGSIFMLLSGGGASIVAADEVYGLGKSKEIANYGEYSGNPSTEETNIYTRNVLELVLASKAKKKVIVIAGGVANFTDIQKTFAGVIQAMEEKKIELKKQKIKVFVRRGGPNEQKGLEAMRRFLTENDLLGKVEGSDYVMTDIIRDSINYLKK